ncbi:hypothetical protein D9M71_787820 [compost metagenome]
MGRRPVARRPVIHRRVFFLHERDELRERLRGHVVVHGEYIGNRGDLRYGNQVFAQIETHVFVQGHVGRNGAGGQQERIAIRRRARRYA